MKKFFGWMLVLLLGASACTSTTMIQSTPPGARVYINQASAGNTPLVYSDTKISLSKTYMRLEYDGYEPLHVELTRDEEVDVGAVIGGLFVGIPFLWTLKYKPVHHYELIPYMYEEEYLPEPDPNYYPDKVYMLRELKALLDDGIITQEEFEKEKAKILNPQEIRYELPSPEKEQEERKRKEIEDRFRESPKQNTYTHDSYSSTGNSISLEGRGMVALPKPKLEKNEEGIVVIEIRVNANGDVISATPTKGSTTTSPYLRELATNAALKARFTAKPNAPDQFGTITYRFLTE